MSSVEDAFSLLEELRSRYGVDGSDPLYGPSLVVPNKDFKREWSRLLSQAGIRFYCGEKAGRVAWIIPVKAWRNNPGACEDPRSKEASDQTSTLRASQGDQPRRGCITGRPWTSLEDEQLLAMLSQGKTPMEIAGILSPKLDRTEDAIKSRLLKLKKRRGPGSKTETAKEKPLETSLEKGGPLEPQPGSSELRSLLESALLLSEDPKHKPALRLILDACLRQASACQGK